MPKISIIVRTRNEERWIASCLRRIVSQTIKETEVILVDNNSSDKTIERAKTVLPDIEVVRIQDYLPGQSLNRGIEKAKGEYVVCLSSHCIPKEDDWLEVMLRNFDENPNLAGVYGRQIPMHFTNSHDKRDLIVTFGLDKRIQRKDPFFHNANSMIPKQILDEYPFDEQTTNIEDRLWAKEVLTAGYHIIYDPEAPVYHHHGIYQNRNEERLRNVIRIIGEDPTDSLASTGNPFHEENLNIGVIIPMREEEDLSDSIQEYLLQRTVEEALASTAVNRVIVTTSSKRIAESAKSYGAEVPFLRPESLEGEHIPVIEVLNHSINYFEEKGEFFDYIVLLETTHPFRPSGIVQLCIEHALKTGLESVIAGMPEYRPGWWLEGEEYRRIDEYLVKRQHRHPIQIGLPAICTVITPALLREGKRIGDRVGIVEMDHLLAQIEIRKDQDLEKVQEIGQLISLPSKSKTS